MQGDLLEGSISQPFPTTPPGKHLPSLPGFLAALRTGDLGPSQSWLRELKATLRQSVDPLSRESLSLQ